MRNFSKSISKTIITQKPVQQKKMWRATIFHVLLHIKEKIFYKTDLVSCATRKGGAHHSVHINDLRQPMETEMRAVCVF